jgi:hypothetical protein
MSERAGRVRSSNRRGSNGRAVGGSGGARVKLGPRDRALLCWIGRQRMVEVRQLAARDWPVGEFGAGRRLDGFGRVSEDTLRQRCAELKSAGYLESRRWFYGRPGVLTATAAGLREGGVDLPAPKVDTRTYAHDLACVSMCVELEREFPCGRVLTEREIRAEDAGGVAPSYSPGQLGRSGATNRIHVPDLAVETEPGADPIAVEIELSPKGRQRLGQIMRLYANADHLAGVRYYVVGDATERAVRRALETAAVNEFTEFATVAALPVSV